MIDHGSDEVRSRSRETALLPLTPGIRQITMPPQSPDGRGISNWAWAGSVIRVPKGGPQPLFPGDPAGQGCTFIDDGKGRYLMMATSLRERNSRRPGSWPGSPIIPERVP